MSILGHIKEALFKLFRGTTVQYDEYRLTNMLHISKI